MCGAVGAAAEAAGKGQAQGAIGRALRIGVLCGRVCGDRVLSGAEGRVLGGRARVCVVPVNAAMGGAAGEAASAAVLVSAHRAEMRCPGTDHVR